MTNLGMHIRTASRLHFGLLGWGPEAGRQFGGVGLMIDSPGIVLNVEPASSWKIDGLHAPRVVQLVDQLQAETRVAGLTLRPARIRVESAPPEHVGLGVGTQLCLAVARTLLQLAGMNNVFVDELARWTGRGRRSGIGLHGFEHGGLIVDGGRRHEADIPPLLARLPFPETWSILVVRPPGESGLHGPAESRAFANLPPTTQDVTDVLCRLVLLEILPAVLERDLAAFGAALGELQARVGACFAPAQGGIYSTAQATQIVDALRDFGFVGVGQSSWGPTLYGFSSLSEQELAAPAQQVRERFGLDDTAVFLTRAANHGATFAVDARGFQ
jgi:beta-ribofuranosylaminobenzene 5'-phosphate synthase